MCRASLYQSWVRVPRQNALTCMQMKRRKGELRIRLWFKWRPGLPLLCSSQAEVMWWPFLLCWPCLLFRCCVALRCSAVLVAVQVRSLCPVRKLFANFQSLKRAEAQLKPLVELLRWIRQAQGGTRYRLREVCCRIRSDGRW